MTAGSKAAKETFDRALRIDPTVGCGSLLSWGNAIWRRSDLEAAGRMFSRVLDLNRGYVGRGRRPVEAGAEDPAGDAGDRDGQEDRPVRADHAGRCGRPLHGGAEDRRTLRPADAEALRCGVQGSGDGTGCKPGRSRRRTSSAILCGRTSKGSSGSGCAGSMSIPTAPSGPKNRSTGRAMR